MMETKIAYMPAKTLSSPAYHSIGVTNLPVEIVVRRRISATLSLLHRQLEWMNILNPVSNIEKAEFDLRHDYGAYSHGRG
mmetsp:Transcript_23794/g.35739  ORF Transcript_23794/g.35739 Transcript_23794/m.35739 type:complete len:80 (-) Transcript_23794:41-280(-)